MAIQRYMVWHGALHGKPNSIADNTEVVEYTDHIAECREREKAAFEVGYVMGATIGNRHAAEQEAEQEAYVYLSRRYGEGRGK